MIRLQKIIILLLLTLTVAYFVTGALVVAPAQAGSPPLNEPALWGGAQNIDALTSAGGSVQKGATKSIFEFIGNIVEGLAVLMIIIGGIQISTAGGNESGAKAGKEKIVGALSGLAFFILIRFILGIVGK